MSSSTSHRKPAKGEAANASLRPEFSARIERIALAVAAQSQRRWSQAGAGSSPSAESFWDRLAAPMPITLRRTVERERFSGFAAPAAAERSVERIAMEFPVPWYRSDRAVAASSTRPAQGLERREEAKLLAQRLVGVEQGSQLASVVAESYPVVNSQWQSRQQAPSLTSDAERSSQPSVAALNSQGQSRQQAPSSTSDAERSSQPSVAALNPQGQSRQQAPSSTSDAERSSQPSVAALLDSTRSQGPFSPSVQQPAMSRALAEAEGQSYPSISEAVETLLRMREEARGVAGIELDGPYPPMAAMVLQAAGWAQRCGLDRSGGADGSRTMAMLHFADERVESWLKAWEGSAGLRLLSPMAGIDQGSASSRRAGSSGPSAAVVAAVTTPGPSMLSVRAPVLVTPPAPGPDQPEMDVAESALASRPEVAAEAAAAQVAHAAASAQSAAQIEAAAQLVAEPTTVDPSVPQTDAAMQSTGAVESVVAAVTTPGPSMLSVRAPVLVTPPAPGPDQPEMDVAESALASRPEVAAEAAAAAVAHAAASAQSAAQIEAAAQLVAEPTTVDPSVPQTDAAMQSTGAVESVVPARGSQRMEAVREDEGGLGGLALLPRAEVQEDEHGYDAASVQWLIAMEAAAHGTQVRDGAFDRAGMGAEVGAEGRYRAAAPSEMTSMQMSSDESDGPISDDAASTTPYGDEESRSKTGKEVVSDTNINTISDTASDTEDPAAVKLQEGNGAGGGMSVWQWAEATAARWMPEQATAELSGPEIFVEQMSGSRALAARHSAGIGLFAEVDGLGGPRESEVDRGAGTRAAEEMDVPAPWWGEGAATVARVGRGLGRGVGRGEERRREANLWSQMLVGVEEGSGRASDGEERPFVGWQRPERAGGTETGRAGIQSSLAALLETRGQRADVADAARVANASKNESTNEGKRESALPVAAVTAGRYATISEAVETLLRMREEEPRGVAGVDQAAGYPRVAALAQAVAQGWAQRLGLEGEGEGPTAVLGFVDRRVQSWLKASASSAGLRMLTQKAWGEGESSSAAPDVPGASEEPTSSLAARAPTMATPPAPRLAMEAEMDTEPRAAQERQVAIAQAASSHVASVQAAAVAQEGAAAQAAAQIAAAAAVAQEAAAAQAHVAAQAAAASHAASATVAQEAAAAQVAAAAVAQEVAAAQAATQAVAAAAAAAVAQEAVAARAAVAVAQEAVAAQAAAAVAQEVAAAQAATQAAAVAQEVAAAQAAAQAAAAAHAASATVAQEAAAAQVAAQAVAAAAVAQEAAAAQVAAQAAAVAQEAAAVQAAAQAAAAAVAQEAAAAQAQVAAQAAAASHAASATVAQEAAAAQVAAAAVAQEVAAAQAATQAAAVAPEAAAVRAAAQAAVVAPAAPEAAAVRAAAQAAVVAPAAPEAAAAQVTAQQAAAAAVAPEAAAVRAAAQAAVAAPAAPGAAAAQVTAQQAAAAAVAQEAVAARAAAQAAAVAPEAATARAAAQAAAVAPEAATARAAVPAAAVAPEAATARAAAPAAPEAAAAQVTAQHAAAAAVAPEAATAQIAAQAAAVAPEAAATQIAAQAGAVAPEAAPETASAHIASAHIAAVAPEPASARAAREVASVPTVSAAVVAPAAAPAPAVLGGQATTKPELASEPGARAGLARAVPTSVAPSPLAATDAIRATEALTSLAQGAAEQVAPAVVAPSSELAQAAAAAQVATAAPSAAMAPDVAVAQHVQPSFARTTPDAPATALPHLATDVATAATAAVAETAAGGGAKAEIGAAAQWLAADLASAATSAGLPSADAVATAAIAPAVHAVSPAATAVSSAAAVAQAGAAVARAAIAPTVPVATADIAVMLAETTRSAAQPAGTALAASQAGSPAQEAGLQTWAAAGAEARGIAAAMSQPVFASRVGRTALQWADAAMTRWAPESTRDQSPSVRSMAFVDRIAALWMSMSTSQRAVGLQRLSSVVAAQAGERSVDNVSWLFPRPWFQDELDWLSASRAGQTAGETIFTTRGTYAAAAAQGLRAPALFDYIAPSFARASSDHGPETFAAPAAAGPYSSLVPLSAVSAAALLSRSIHEIHSAQALARGPLDSAGAVWTGASMQVPVLAGGEKERSSGDASESMRTLVALVGSLIPDSELARFGSQMIQTIAAQPAAPGAGDGAKLAHDSIVQMQSRAVAQALAHAREQLSAHMQRSAREARERVVPDAVADRSIAVPIGGSLDRAVSSVDDPEATTESMMSFIHHDEIRNEITRQERHRADNTKSATVRARASARLQARIDILVAEQIARLEQAAALAPSSSLESVRGLEASAAAVIEDAGFNEIQVQAWRQVLRMAELLAHSAAIGPSAMAPVAGPRLAMPTGLGGLIAAMHTAASVDRTRTAPRDSSLAWQPAPWPRTFAVADESERFTGAGRATATGLRSQWTSRPLSPMAPTSSTLAAIAAQAPVALGHLAWVDRWLGRFAGASESALATMGAASMRAQLAPQQPVVSATAEHEGLTTQRSSAVEAAISQSAASLPRVLPLTTSVPRSAGATSQPWSHPTLDSSASAADALRFADDDVVSDDVFAAIASGTTTRRTGSTPASNSGVTTGARSIASTKVPENVPGNAPGNAPGIGSTIAAALAAARVRDLEVVTARDAAASPADVVARTAPTAPVNAGLSAALAASPMAAVLGHVLALPRAAVFDPRSLAGSELAVAFLAGALSAPMVTQFVTDAVASMSTASSAALELATTSPWRQWSAELVQPAEQSRAAARVESAQRARWHDVSLDRVTSAWATESGSRLSTAAAAASASSLAVSDVAHTHGAMPAALPATLDLGSAAAGTAPRWRSAAPTTAPEVGSVATGAVGERSTSPVGVVVGALDALDGPHAPHAPDASTQVSAALRPAAEVVAAPAGAAGGHGIVTLRSMLLSPASPRQQRLAETFGTSAGWANRESAENLPVAYQTLGELLREAAVDPSAWSRRTSASQPPRLATEHAGAALLAAGRPGAWPLGAAADVESASAMAGSSSEHYAEFLTRSSAQRDLPLLVWPLAGGAPAGALIQLALAASLPAGFSASLPSAAAAASHASAVPSGAVAASRSATAALPGALSVAPPPSSLAPVRLGGGLGSDLGAPASGATTAAARPALRTALETIAARDQLHSVQAQRELLTASSDSGGRGLRGSMDRGASSPGMLAERALAFGAAQSMQSADLSLDFVAPELVLAARMYGFGAVEAAQAARLAIGGATGLSMMAGAVDLRFVSQAVRSGLLDGVAATQRSAALAPSALAPDSQRGPVSSPITPGSPLAASPGWGGQQAHRLDDAGYDGAFGVNRRVPRGAFLLPEASVAAMGLVAALPDGEFAMPVAALEILAAKMVAEMGNLAVPERAATASQHPPSQAMHARAAQVESALAGVLSSLAAGPVAGPAAPSSDVSSDARMAAASTIPRERDLSFDRAPLERAMVAEVVGAGSPGSEALAQAIASIEPSRRAGFEARFRSLYAAFAASPDAASMSPAVRAARALAFAHQDQDSLGLSPKERAALAWNMVPIVVDGGQAGEGRGEGRDDRSDNDRSGTGSRSGEFGRRAERAANSMAGAASVTETAGRRAGRNAPELTAVQGAEAAEESSGLRAAPSSRPGMRRLSARAGEALSSFVTSQATDSQPSAGSPQQSGGRSWKSGRFGGGEVEIPSWFESASRRMFADRTEVGGFAISDLTLVASTPRTQVAAASRDSAAAPAPKEASADGTTKSGPRVDIPKVAHEVYNEVQQIMRSARNRNGAPFL